MSVFKKFLTENICMKNKYSKKSPTKKPKVAETSETAEIIELSKTKVKRD